VAARLSWSEGRLVGRVADREIVCYDFSAPPRADARRGLFVAGQADFLDFESGTEPQDGATIGTVSGAAQFVPGEGEGTRRPVVGYVWEPSKGAWSPTPLPTDESAQGLVAKAHKAEEPAELWYYQDCPGDTRLTARDCIAPEGATIGLSLSQNKEDRQSGYALEHVVGSGKLALTRLGQTVAESEVGPLTGEGISLWRDGAYVVARAGETGLAFVDAEPLQTPRCCAYATTGGGFAELQLSNRRALAYSFRSVEPDWQPAEGTWMTHSGMACIAWDYWLTGKGEPVATAFNHKPQPADLHVDFWISEYTEGFADGEHRHYPYHDVSLITCAQQRERDSGYRFVVGADGGKAVLLYKKGSQVAETTDSRFSIRMAGHCNIPRSMHVVVSQQTGVLRLSLDGVEALRYEDPEPLAGGLVGIGVEGCAVDFKDLWMVGTGPK